MLVMAGVESPSHEIVIQPSRGLFTVDWREFWEYRDLLQILVQRDITSRYKQTMLGPLWFIVEPILMAVVFAIVFGRVAGISTDGIPGPLFYLCGLLGWNYFSQNVSTAGASFVNNAHLFTKVYFPRLVVPVATVVSNLVVFAVQLIPFVGFLLYYEIFTNEAKAIHLTWHILLIPLPLLQVAALSLGVSLWMSASTAKYRDLIHLNRFVLQIWMFATPIIYPLSKIPPHWEWLIWINPMSAPVEAFRLLLLGRGTLDVFTVVFSTALTVIILLTGLIAFRKVEGTVVDSV